jgi:hypothetical protein
MSGTVFAVGFTDWHTSPQRWEKPRIYHIEFDEDFASTSGVCDIRIGKGVMGSQFCEKTWSPNKAYWFTTIGLGPTKAGPRIATISVFNERDYLLQISLSDLKYEPKVKWINEKLLYIRMWWGTLLGTDIIYDVEKEEIIYKEMFCNGEILFQQFQEVKERVRRKE